MEHPFMERFTVYPSPLVGFSMLSDWKSVTR